MGKHLRCKQASKKLIIAQAEILDAATNQNAVLLPSHSLSSIKGRVWSGHLIQCSNFSVISLFYFNMAKKKMTKRKVRDGPPPSDDGGCEQAQEVVSAVDEVSEATACLVGILEVEKVKEGVDMGDEAVTNPVYAQLVVMAEVHASADGEVQRKKKQRKDRPAEVDPEDVPAPSSSSNLPTMVEEFEVDDDPQPQPKRKHKKKRAVIEDDEDEAVITINQPEAVIVNPTEAVTTQNERKAVTMQKQPEDVIEVQQEAVTDEEKFSDPEQDESLWDVATPLMPRGTWRTWRSSRRSSQCGHRHPRRSS
jgi:hypothetical protein